MNAKTRRDLASIAMQFAKLHEEACQRCRADMGRLDVPLTRRWRERNARLIARLTALAFEGDL